MSKRLFLFLAFSALAIFSYAALMEFKVFNFSKNAIENAKPLKRRVLEIIKECEGNSVKLSTTAAGPYQWQKDGTDEVGKTANSYKPTLAGAYRLIIGTDTSNTIDLEFLVPEATFTTDNTGTNCGSETINFTNTSINAKTYYWEFGDGNNSTQKNPVHDYEADLGIGIQEFTVKLTVKTADCKSDVFTKKIKINRKPDIDISGNFQSTIFDGKKTIFICSDTDSKFKINNISKSKATNTSYRIIWGDGSEDYVSNSFTSLERIYSVGIRTLKIIATSEYGCTNEQEYSVFVGTQPGGVLDRDNFNPICVGGSLTFKLSENTKQNPPGTIYRIQFNDGSSEIKLVEPLTDAQRVFVKTFNKSSCGFNFNLGSPSYNTFGATFVAENPCNFAESGVTSIYVSEKPKAGFSKNVNRNICEGESVIFTNASTGKLAKPSRNPVTCENAKFVWSVEGANVNDYIVTGDLGEVDSDNIFIDGSGQISIKFTKPGKYVVKIRANHNSSISDCGEDVYSEEICVNPKPVADFTLPSTTSCAPFTVKPTNTSNSPLCGTNTYQWTVSQTSLTACENVTVFTNLTSTLENPEFNLTLPGVYRIKLITKNTDGNCVSAEVFKEVTVKAPPTAVISLSSVSICEGQSIDASATVKNCYSATAATYEWEFPSSNTPTSTLAAPTNVKYDTKGTYTVKLKVTNECGTNTTVYTKEITVNATAVGGKTSGAKSTCGPAPAGTINLSEHTGTVSRWERSSDGVNWSNITNTTTTLNYATLNSTTYFRAFVVSGACGQEYSTTTIITVTQIPVKPNSTTSIDYCLNDVATALSASGDNLKWYKNSVSAGNILGAAPTPNTSIATTSKYYVTQTVNGCESAATEITVIVNPAIANNTISADQTICLNTAPATLVGAAATGGKPGVYNYQWQFSSDGTAASYTNILGATQQDYKPDVLSADAYYRRVVKSGTCSSVSNTVKITVQGTLDNTNISGNQTICSGSIPAKIIGELPRGGDGVFTYVWAKSTTSATAGFTGIVGAVGVDYQPPALTQTTYYRRTVKSGPCTAISDVITVKVNPIPVLEQLNDVMFCAGQSVATTTIKADLNGSEVTFAWTNDNTAIGLGVSGSGNVPSFTAENTSKKPITATIKYYATYTDDAVACKTTEKSFVITVLPTFAVVTDLKDFTVCNNATVPKTIITTDAENFVGSTVSYRWAGAKEIGLPDGNGVEIPSFTATNNTIAPISSTITVTPVYKFNGKACDGVPKTYTITVNPSPKVAFGIVNQVICSNTQTTEVVLSSTSFNVTFKWTAAPVAGISGLEIAGTDKIPVQTLLNTTNAPIVVVYKAVAVTTGEATCDGPESSYQITVNPVPKLTVSDAAKTICSGTKPNIRLSSNVALTTFTWTASANVNITGAADGTGNQITATLVNTSNSPQTVTYTITPKYANGAVNCDGVPVEVVITVNPAPAVTFSERDVEICSGETTSNVTLSSTTADAKISWTVSVPIGITGVAIMSGTNTINAETFINTTSNALTVVYSAIAKTDDANACAGSVTTYSVKVNPSIANNKIAANETICLNSTPKTLVSTGSPLSGGTGNYTYVWEKKVEDEADFTVIAGENGATYSPPALIKTTSYRRLVKSGTCGNTSNTIIITVQGTLTKTDIAGNQTICNGELPTVIKGESPIGGDNTYTYVWEKSTTSALGGFDVILNANAIDYQPSALTQTTYFRRKVNSGSCSAISSVVTVKVNPIPEVEALPNLVVCKDQSIPITVFKANLKGSEISFGWSNDNIGIGLAASGTGDIDTFSATNNSKKPIVSNITYFSTYTDDVACKSPTKQFSITVLPTIAITTNLPDVTLCNGVKVNEIVVATDADPFAGSLVTYRWTGGDAIGLADDSGAKIPSFTAKNTTDAAVTVSVTVTPQYTYNGKTCDGTPKSYQITINPSPKVTFSIANQVICNKTNTAEVLLTSATNNVTFKWTAENVAGITGLINSGTDKIPVQTLVNSTNAPITVVYKAFAKTSGDAVCDGVESLYKVIVNPTPILTVSDQTKTICSATQPNITLSSNVLGTTFHWTVSANASITGAADGDGNKLNQALVNSSALPQIITYTITPKYLNSTVNCDGTPVVVTITVNPVAKVNFSSANANVCSGELIPAVQLTSLTTNAKISWTAVVPAGITGISSLSGTTSINAETLVNTTNLPLTVIYKAVAETDDATACVGEISEYSVTVNPIAKLTNVVLAQQICSGANTTAVILKSNVNAAVFSWVATSSSPNLTGFAASGNGDIPIQRLVNSGTTVEKITFDIVTTAYGCVGVPSKYEITVSPSPVFTSSLASLSVCSGKLFTYVPTSSTANVNFKWTRAFVAGISNAASSGGGIDGAGAINETLVNTTINPIEVTYEYEMTLNGCASGIKYPIVVTVNPPTTAKFGLSQINGCAPFNLVIKNLNSRALPSKYTVDFGDGSPFEVYNDTRDILHTYENESKFVKLFYIVITTSNECGEAISTPFEIRVQPQGVYSKLVLNATQSFGCAPLSVDFTTTNQSTGANLFTWDFGDGSPVRQTRTVNERITHTYSIPGDYTIKLTATNGCSTVSSTQQITIYPQVSASFTIDKVQVCVTNEVVFTNTSDAQFTAKWDFGDGTTSTAINPKHTYLTSGLKTVTLSATRSYPNGGTCTAVTTRTIQILAAPVSTFTTNASALNCGPFKLQVNATSTNLSNVTWNFGEPGADGNIIGGLAASYTYTKAGDYLVTATAYNAQGCISVSTQTVRVTESPIAAFSTAAQQFCGTSATVNFKNETTYGAEDVLSYKWLTNNTIVATSKDLNYAFEVPVGATLPYVFKVSLIATNMVGCSTKMEKNIQFNPFPKAVFNVVQVKGCVPFKLDINNQSVYADQYEWYLDGVLVSKLKTPNDIILTDFNKTYALKLLVKNRYGCTENEQVMQVSTHPYLKADFTLAQDLSCNGVLNLQVTNTSVGATGYTWDYGDGSPIYVGENPVHSYGKPGVYNLKLSVSNGFCTDSYTKKVTVSNAPKAAFLSDVRNGCNQLTVKFKNTSANATEYLWDFGDGTFSKEENPEHHYIYSKTAYTVKLTVKNAVGCSDESVATNFINVLPPPEATILITPNKIIKVPEYSFTFKAVTTENIIAYKWDFGDGQTANKPELIHKYDRFGTYKIKLHLTNISNCTNIIEDEVTILDFPGYLFIPNAFEPENLNNDLKIFKVKGGGMATYSMKIFNKWGQLIWQTIALDDQGVPLEYWDGMDKGTFLPQGAYFWQAEATFINGGVWKGMKYGNKAETKTGVIHLIR